MKFITKSKYTATQERLFDRLLAMPEKEREYVAALLESMEKNNPKDILSIMTYDSEDAFRADWIKGFSYYYAACAGEGSSWCFDPRNAAIRR